MNKYLLSLEVVKAHRWTVQKPWHRFLVSHTKNDVVTIGKIGIEIGKMLIRCFLLVINLFMTNPAISYIKKSKFALFG